MNFKFILEFMKTKKGKATIIAAVGGAVTWIFPESLGVIADGAEFIAEVLDGVADKIEPNEPIGE